MNNFNLDILEKKNKELLAELNSLKGKKDLVAQQIKEVNDKLDNFKHKRELYTKSVELLTIVQQMTRNKIKEGFEQIITYALRTIFNKDYKFILEFGKRGNLQEVDFKILPPGRKEGNDVLNSCGGGVIDITSFALRIALMQLSKPKIQGMLCLDESFKHLSENYISQCAKFLKEISKKLDRQVIMTTHKEKFKELVTNIIEL